VRYTDKQYSDYHNDLITKNQKILK